MKSFIGILTVILVLSFTGNASARSAIGLIKVTEADGSPSAYVNEIVVPNDTLSTSGAVGTQTLPATLGTLNAITYSANTQSLLAAADYAAMKVLLGLADVIQTPLNVDNEDAVTLDAGDVVFLAMTGTGEPTNFTMTETNASEGQIGILFNAGTTSLKTGDDAGVLELDGNTIIPPGKFLIIKYVTDRYYGYGGYGLSEVWSAINLAPSGIGQFNKKIINSAVDYNLIPTEMDSTIFMTAGGRVNIPDSSLILSGAFIRCFKIGTADTYVRSLNASHVITNYEGTAFTAADMVKLDDASGSMVELTYRTTNDWRVTDREGVPADGGVPGGGAATYIADGNAIAAYLFENDLTDETANSNDLTDSGTITYETATPAPPNGTYSALFVAASSQYGYSASADFDFTTTFSICGRVYFNSDDYSPIAAKGTSVDSGYLIRRHGGNNAFQFQISSDGTATESPQTATDSAPTGEWIFFAITNTGTAMKFYIAGLPHDGGSFPSGSYAYSGGVNDTVGNFMVGRSEDIGSYMDGNLKDLYVTNDVLSDAEIYDIEINGLQ